MLNRRRTGATAIGEHQVDQDRGKVVESVDERGKCPCDSKAYRLRGMVDKRLQLTGV